MNIKMCFDKSGVPILRDKNIEEIAYRILSEYDALSLETPMPAPIPGLLKYLKQNYGLNLDFPDNLGKIGNYYIVGRTVFSKNLICIWNRIVNIDKIFLFTSAHEIGHWVLHRYRKIKKNQKGKEYFSQIDDNRKDFFFRKKLESPRDWIEHHANVFAASITMPEIAIKKKVISIQKELGITRNLGKIYLDDQYNNYKDYFKIINILKDSFKVSKTSLEVRLKRLELLEDNRSPMHISQSLNLSYGSFDNLKNEY